MRSVSRLAIMVGVLTVASVACSPDSPEPDQVVSSTSSQPPVDVTYALGSTLDAPVVQPLTGEWRITDMGLGDLPHQARDLIWDGRHFFAMLRVEPGDIRIWRSLDALDWEEIPQLGTAGIVDGPRSLVSNNGNLFALGDRDGVLTMWTYDGGASWSEESLGIDGVASEALLFSGVYVAVGSPPTAEQQESDTRPVVIWASTDRSAWGEVAGTEMFTQDSRFRDLFLGGDGIVVVVVASATALSGEDGTPTIVATSANGMSWRVMEEDEVQQLGYLIPSNLMLLPDPQSSFTWIAQTPDTSLSTTNRFGTGAMVSEWKSRAVLSGMVFEDVVGEDQPVPHPGVWRHSLDDIWVEVGSSISQLSDLLFVGEMVGSGDRMVAFGADRENNGMSVIVTFVVSFPAGYVAPDWINQTGLAQTDAGVWAERLDRACAEGVWDDDVAWRLAEEFVIADLPLSARADGLTPSTNEAAASLWRMAVNYCRADFPAGEIADGPPAPRP